MYNYNDKKYIGSVNIIAVKRISDVGRGEYDESYAIVRSMKSQSDWLIQEPLLSPSKDLFFKYLSLKKAGKWDQQAFDSIYVPQFIRELKSNPAALKKLNELFGKSKEGRNIALCCFCPTEELCHRAIIAGLFQGVGADVEVGADYSRYYNYYRNLLV